MLIRIEQWGTYNEYAVEVEHANLFKVVGNIFETKLDIPQETL